MLDRTANTDGRKCDFCHDVKVVDSPDRRLVSIEPYRHQMVHLACAERIASRISRQADGIRDIARIRIEALVEDGRTDA